VVDETQDAWPTGRAPVFAAMAPMDNLDNIRQSAVYSYPLQRNDSGCCRQTNKPLEGVGDRRNLSMCPRRSKLLSPLGS